MPFDTVVVVCCRFEETSLVKLRALECKELSHSQFHLSTNLDKNIFATFGNGQIQHASAEHTLNCMAICNKDIYTDFFLVLYILRFDGLMDLICLHQFVAVPPFHIG
ncbi:hypothetical protein TNCV_2945481 [Trichonephila clavipes]|nr:hypothetical protein TNCV_2945481 [Trichonephila clavipes]